MAGKNQCSKDKKDTKGHVLGLGDGSTCQSAA